MKRSNRRSIRRTKKRRLSSRMIVKALASGVRFRGKAFGSVVTGASQATHPITLRIPTNASGSNVFFDASMNVTIRGLTAGSTNNTWSTIVDYNALNYTKNWIVIKVKNVALTPCYLKIYDVFCNHDIGYTYNIDITEDTVPELLYKNIFESFTALLAPSALTTAVVDSALGPYVAGDGFFQLASEGIFNSSHVTLKQNWEFRKCHKVFLNPGQTYEYKVHPHNVKVSTIKDAVDEIMGYKKHTFVPLVMARGDLGITAANAVGYTAVELVWEYDYGTNLVQDRLNFQGSGAGIQYTAATFPGVGTAVAAPGDDGDVA